MAKIEQKAVIEWDCDIRVISGTKWVSKDEADATIKKLTDSEGNGWIAALIMAVMLIWSLVYIATRH